MHSAERMNPFPTNNGTLTAVINENEVLLLFRNVTYFPLTWSFAVDEFGWEYSYDEENGLVINSK